MSEPPAQFRAGSNVLEPKVQGSRLFLQAPGPKPFHQDPEAVLPDRFFIGPLQTDHLTDPCTLIIMFAINSFRLEFSNPPKSPFVKGGL
jgi:hypothetical protein